MTDPLRAAEEALRPFAEAGSLYSDSVEDWMTAELFTVGACRRAASALDLIRAARAAVPADRDALAQRLLIAAEMDPPLGPRLNGRPACVITTDDAIAAAAIVRQAPEDK